MQFMYRTSPFMTSLNPESRDIVACQSLELASEFSNVNRCHTKNVGYPQHFQRRFREWVQGEVGIFFSNVHLPSSPFTYFHQNLGLAPKKGLSMVKKTICRCRSSGITWSGMPMHC